MDGRHLMIDLETLGTRPGCAVLAVGAVVFTARGIESEFYRRIAWEDHARHGFDIDAETVRWWLKQDDAARLEVARADLAEVGYETMARAFAAWGAGVQIHGVWGNGASFDVPILQEVFRRIGRRWPMSPWVERCFRTARAMHPELPYQKPAAAHHALEDAKAQAEWLVELWGNAGDLAPPPQMPENHE